MISLSRKVPLVAVEITSSCVKVLELSRGRGGYKVEACAKVPIPESAMSDREISDMDAMAEIVEKAIDMSGTRCKHAVTTVHDSAAITKVLSLSSELSSFELDEQVRIDAEQHIPFSMDEVMLDYSVVGPSAGSKEFVDVLVVAVRNTVVENRQAVLQLAGLEVNIVDVDSYASEHVVNYMKENGIVDPMVELIGVCDIGKRYTTFNVVQNDALIYSREQSFGGYMVAEEMQRFYGMDAKEAEAAQLAEEGLPSDYQASVIDPFVGQLCEQISQFRELFFSSSGLSNLDILLVTGGIANIDGIEQSIENEVGISTSVANPFSAVSVPRKFARKGILLEEHGSDMFVPFGLALRNFD